MIDAMVRVVRTETRTGQLLVKVSLPRVDALIAEHPDRYTIPGVLRRQIPPTRTAAEARAAKQMERHMTPSPWFVLIIGPQQEIPTVWRMPPARPRAVRSRDQAPGQNRARA